MKSKGLFPVIAVVFLLGLITLSIVANRQRRYEKTKADEPASVNLSACGTTGQYCGPGSGVSCCNGNYCNTESWKCAVRPSPARLPSRPPGTVSCGKSGSFCGPGSGTACCNGNYCNTGSWQCTVRPTAGPPPALCSDGTPLGSCCTNGKSCVKAQGFYYCQGSVCTAP